MKLTATWASLVLFTMVGGCSGKLDQDVEAYKQGASVLGAGGSGGGGSGKGGSGGSGSTTGGAGSASGSPVAMQPKPMGSADGGGWNDSGVKPATPPTPPRAPSDGGAVAEAGGGSTPAAPDAMPAMPPPSASACPNGLDALTIMAQKCGTCHGERTPTKGLDLVTPGVTARLVGVRSGCNARPFLDPMGSGSASSYFIEKLDGDVAGCGVKMPFGAAPLTRDERACLEEWADKAIARGQVGR
jgi:hypothetical protein